MGSYEQTMLKLEKMAQANTATQMNWQKQMSDTSHQREVKDLIAAGLNPVLSSGGSGAQSYTTSVDSAVNGIASMASAREGANATRYAAQQSAAATRAAAAANLAAAREAAAASRYSADKHLEATQYQTDHSKTGSVAGVLSNIFNKGVEEASQRGIFQKILKQVDKTRSKNPQDFLNNPNKAFSWKNMNARGIRVVNDQMKQFGVKRTAKTQDIFIDAFYNHNKDSMTKWTALVRAANKNRSSANYLNRLYNY